MDFMPLLFLSTEKIFHQYILPVHRFALTVGTAKGVKMCDQ